jgi:drug/metabolite transporter (DMT)-like permease
VLTVVLGLGAAFFYALSDFLMVRVVRTVPVATALVWLVGVGVLVSVPLALAVDGMPSGGAQLRDVGLAALGGVTYMAALGALFRGLVVGQLSVVSPLSALEGAFAASVAIVLGGWIGGWFALGLPLAVLGGVLAATERSDKTTPRQPSPAHWGAARGAAWAITSAAAGGATILLYGWAADLPPLTCVALSRIASFVVVLTVAGLRGDLQLPLTIRRRVILIGLIDVVAFLSLAAATSKGPVAVAAVTTAQFATFAVILGVAVLKEKPAPLQRLGIAVTLVAVTLLAFSG